MGYGSMNLHMPSIIIFMFMTFHCIHIVCGLQEVYEKENNHVEKVSGEDENEEKKALMLEKFRTLLGLKSFNARSPFNGDFEYESPSPSPSSTIEEAEAEAPAPPPAPSPAPVLPILVHSHPPSPRSRPVPPPPHKAQKEEGDKGRRKRVLVAALVSVGATIVVCGIGLFCVCQKFRKQRKRSTSIVSTTHSTEGGSTRGGSKYVSSQNTLKKVNSDLTPDLFYLESLGTALESQPFCVKQDLEPVNTLTNQETSNSTLHEREDSESSTANCLAAGKIMSLHGIEESVKYDSDGCNSSSGNKIIPVDADSSDDESFHSLCDSHSPNVRLSNASVGSLSEKSEIISPNVSKTSCSETSPMNFATPLPTPDFILTSVLDLESHPPQIFSPNVSKTPCSNTFPMNLAIPSPTPDSISTSVSELESHSPQFPCNTKQNMQAATSNSSNCQNTFVPPPPPPPPPPPTPPPRVHISPSHSSSCSTKITSKALSSSTLPNSLSPRNSDSSSGSNQTPKSDMPPSPPNPPKPLVGIPPPPCPPPFLKRNGNPLKGPPPPPSQFPRYTPLGKDGAPLPKLKPLHWDKVRAAPNRSTVWDKMRSSSFELDEKMIESLFGYNLQNSMKNDEAKSKSPSPCKHVLESKRLQNITILSKALNATSEQVCDALIRGNGLCLQQLEALVKMVPTKEEEDKLSNYKGDITELGSAERFVKAMLKIPFAFTRFEAMLYKETFEDEVVHLRKSFSMLEEACKELRSSRLFLKLLEAVLKTGNRMNIGTIRGGAKAFKLDALLKLADVKGTNGKTTLLHFVVQEISRSEGIRVSESIVGKINQKSRSRNAEEREEDYRRMGLELVSGLSNELFNVKKTAAIDLDVLASSVSNLSDGMAKLQHLVHKDLCMDEKSGNFVHSMRSFLGHAEKNIKELQEDENRVLLHVREITEYFHGDVSKDESNPLRIFVIVRDFLGMLDHVCKELRSLKVPRSPNPLAPFR
ncbi:formin-like protein 11 [Cornus florida]|uniref:formin-like protein 11 n=1 Tax=Cornus florida TaxID=4283 RepID=UPI0028991F4F|nr:formin-like protein 11 [Cornus florida]